MARNNNISQITVGRRALLSEELKNNWESLDINQLDIPQDTTVCMFGGNVTLRPNQANGNSKVIESLLPKNLRDRINLYSFGYASEPIKSEGYLSKEYEKETKLLYKKTFEPVLYDSAGNMKEKQGIERAFSKLIFSAHCGGCNFANIIIDEFYNSLLTKYSPATAEMLINKIQYFAYAPNEMPNHNVNALLIAPYIDPSFSWAKSLAFAESQKVDVDYPKGIIKKIMKAKNNGSLQAIFNSTFEDSRAIMFKIGHCVCMIPSQMNPHKNIGDHSIALVVKSKNNDESNYSQTAEIASNATSLFFDRASKSKPIDSKSLFALISQELTNNPPNFGIQPE